MHNLSKMDHACIISKMDHACISKMDPILIGRNGSYTYIFKMGYICITSKMDYTWITSILLGRKWIIHVYLLYGYKKLIKDISVYTNTTHNVLSVLLNTCQKYVSGLKKETKDKKIKKQKDKNNKMPPYM